MFFFQMPFLPEFMLEHDGCSTLNMMFRDADKKRIKNTTQEDIEAYKYTFSKKGTHIPLFFVIVKVLFF